MARPGGKPEPPNPERARALALFREAVAQSARLHALFLALADQATASVKETEDNLASRAEADLDRGLETLRRGLELAQLELDRSADAADSFIEQRRLLNYIAITKAANSAFGALNALKAMADQTFQTHDTERTTKGSEADAARSEVTGAGEKAANEVRGLKDTAEHDHPINIKPAMDGAVNESIDEHMPTRSEERAKTYDEERTAQNDQLSAIFKGMTDKLQTQFTELSTAMKGTAKNSAGSIAKSRDAARAQLAKGAHQMHNSVAQARARGHAALIGQHNMLRRQMIASHRDRALRENTLAQQRAARGTGAALEAAKGQQAGASSLGAALGKEASRPPDDFAKVMIGSAGGLLHQLEKAGPEQKNRLARSVAAGETDAEAQSQTLGRRLDGSADEAAGQLEAAASSSGDALREQARTGSAPFDEIPGQVDSAFESTFPTTKKAYEAQNEGTKEQPGAGQLIISAGEGIKATINGDGGGTGDAKATGDGAPAGDTKKKPKEKPKEFQTRSEGIAKDPKSDDGITDLFSTANGDIRDRIEKKVGPLYNALMAFSTNVESVMAELRGVTAQQGRALSESYYAEEGNRDLAFDLRTELWKTFSSDYTNEHNINAALNYLAGNAVEAADLELEAAVYLWNDTGRSEKVLRALKPKQLDELNKKHGATMDDVSGDLDESEKKVFDALKQIKPVEDLQGAARTKQIAENYKLLGIANAHALKSQIDQAMETKGEAGGDKAADTVALAYQSAGSDTLSGGEGVYENPEAAEARRKAIWENTNKSFAEAAPTLPDGSPNIEAAKGPKLNSIARYAAAARTYTEFVPDDEGGHYEAVQKGLDPLQARLINDIAEKGPNSEEAAASTIDFETNRKEGKPREDRLRKAMLGDDLMAGQDDEERKTLRPVKDDKGNIVQKSNLERAKERKATILKLVAERRAEGQKTADDKPVAPQSPEQVQKQIAGQLDQRFGGDATGAAYTKSMIESETLEADPSKAFDFALAHDERNKETLKATTERMNRDQVKAAVAKWDEGKPESERLYARLGMYGHEGKLEGDARNEVEIAFRGKPRNDKEKALIAIMVAEQQHRDSAATGRALARGEYDRMMEKQATVLRYLGVRREDIDEQGDIKATGPDGQPIKGKWDEKTGQLKLGDAQRNDFESAMRFSHMHAESYKQAVDRIAQGIVMALVVAAAIITTFVTFGGAAAIWGPILITAAAGFAGMGMTKLIRGDRYTKAEMQRDFVMTLVQAATAGLGAGLGAAAKGAGAAAKGAVAVEEGALAAAATGEKLAAGAAGLAGKEMTLGAKALQFGKEVVIGGATNSINSFAAAAMDPENRRQGKALDKAVEGGIKGFISGSVGAAVTKPAGALGAKFGKAGERLAGNVSGGFATRLAEARMGQAMGDPHQSWAESIEGAKEGIGQDIIQALGEHGAEHLAEQRAARKAQARAAARAEEPPARPGAREAPPTPPAHGAQEGGLARAAAVQDALPSEVRPIAQAVGGRSRSELDAVTKPAARPVVDEGLPRGPPAITDETKGTASTRPAAPRDETAVTIRGAPREEERAASARGTAPDEEDVLRSNKPRGERDTIPEMQAVKPVVRMDEKPLTFAELAASKAGPPPGRRVVDTLDLTPEMLHSAHSLPEESIIRGSDPKDRAAAERNYQLMRERDPHREVLLAYHPETGEYAVVQGGMDSVRKPPGGGWIAERHTHPRTFLVNDQAAILHSLPSGKPGDFGALISEAQALAARPDKGGVAVRASKIDILQPDGSLTETTFAVILQDQKMELMVTFRDPAGQQQQLGPFTSIAEYGAEVFKLTGTDIARPAKAAPEGAYNLPGSRRSTPVSAEDVATARFAAERMGATTETKGPVRALGVTIETQVRPFSAAAEEAHAAVKRLGLVGERDSLVRLTNLLNIDDPTFTPAMRAAVANATLEATRAELIRTGALQPGDDVLMLFRGVTKGRMGDYEREGMNLAKLGPGSDEDAGRGLYGSQDFESALRYTGPEGSGGQVLPLIVRRSELGNVIDARSGTPLGDRWLEYIRANRGGAAGVVKEGYEHLRGALDPRTPFPIGLERASRGTRFEEYLKTVTNDPTLPESVRAAAADPHITLMDLGGVVSWGNDRGTLTDQWAMHSQHIADLFNEAHGFPVPGREGPGSVTVPSDESSEMLRSNVPGRRKGPAPGSPSDPAEIAAMARTGSEVDEINRMQDALKDVDRDGVKATIATIRADDPGTAPAAQEHLNKLYGTQEGAIVVNISDERINRLGDGLEPGKSHRVLVEGMWVTLYRPKRTRKTKNPPVRYDVEIPVQAPDAPLKIYQFGDGELRAWRTPATNVEPAGRIVQSSLVSEGKKRKGLEANRFSQGESFQRTSSTAVGPQAAGYHGRAMERGHLHGAGLGFESPIGIGLVPREVNQELQARGIEKWMQRLRDALPPGAELIYTTDVTWHGTSQRHSQIDYKLEIVIKGETHRFAEFTIHVGNDPAWTPSARRGGATGVHVSPLTPHYGTTREANVYLRALHEIVDSPENLRVGLARPAPTREQMGQALRRLPSDEIVRMAAAAKPNILASHNPPPKQEFQASIWERRLKQIVTDKPRPRHVVVDLRGLGLKALQKEQIGRALGRLSKRNQQRILLLDDKATYSSKMSTIFRNLLIAWDEDGDD